MLITQQCHPEKRPVGIPPRSSPCGPALARKLVNIAGIGPGDRVLVAGNTDAAVETAILATGGQPVRDTGRRRRLVKRLPIDLVLCDLGPPEPHQPGETLELVRRHLRSGGRLVVWAAVGAPDGASPLKDAFQRMMHTAGFSSVIVGQLSTVDGTVVVATGIVSNRMSIRK